MIPPRAKFAWLGLCLFCCLTSAIAQRPLPPRSDLQQWNDVQISIPVAAKVDLIFQGMLWNGRNVHRPIEERAYVGVAFKPWKFLTLTPGYQYQGDQPAAGKETLEHRITMAATFRFPIAKFLLADRNLVEHRLVLSRPNSTRYRNRAYVEYPVVLDGFKFSIFTADEAFYEWSNSAWSRNRLWAGATKKLSDHVALDLYYMRQSDRRARPGDLNVVGASWRIKL
jgi:Protein of unknown function (DUF2490)